MEFVIGLIAGALVGVLAERALGSPLDRFVMEPLANSWRKRRARSAAQGIQVNGEVVELSNGGVFVAQFAPAGIDIADIHARVKATGKSLEQLYANSRVSLRGPEWPSVERAVEDMSRRIRETPRMWNGLALSVVAAYVSRTPEAEETELEIEFEVRDYATCRAVQEVWLGLEPRDRRELLAGDAIREVDPFIASGFGLNLTVETSDGKVLLTRRGSHTSSWPNHRHISMNEGLNQSDMSPGGRVNIQHAFVRGLHEELGIHLETMSDYALDVHSLILDIDRYEWALLGHLDLRRSGVTSADLRQMRIVGMAADSWESSDLLFEDFTLAAISSEFDRQDEWIPHGLMNLALSYAYRFPSRTKDLRRLFR